MTCPCMYLVSAPSWVPEYVDDWTPAAQASVEVVVSMGCVVVVLCKEKSIGLIPLRIV